MEEFREFCKQLVASAISLTHTEYDKFNTCPPNFLGLGFREFTVYELWHSDDLKIIQHAAVVLYASAKTLYDKDQWDFFFNEARYKQLQYFMSKIK